MHLKEVTYVANAGVLLKLNDKKILIDGFCTSVVPMFKCTPADISRSMILGTPPYDRIDLLLFTHHHGDHFDLESTVQFLREHPETPVISTSEVISEISRKISNIKVNNLIALKSEQHCKKLITINEINVQAISTTHYGANCKGVPNFAYLIEYGKKVLHVGDAKPSKENYQSLNLKQEKIDLLIAPFTYMRIPSARKMIQEHISPKRIAIVHLPYVDHDSYEWINTTKHSYNRVKNDFIETEFLEEPGCDIAL